MSIQELARAQRSDRPAWLSASGARASWAALGLVLTAAVGLRVIGLERLPGINGDEAYYGVYALAWLDGAPLSTLRTGTGLPMNPVFMGPVVLLQAWLGPSFFGLRLAALVQSLATIALVLGLFRVRGWLFTGLFAAAVAALPIHLGYARFAWDAAAVPTVMALALAAATRRHALATLLAFGLCLWVHPMTIFALPILVAPFVGEAWPRDAEGRPRWPRRWVWIVAAAGPLLLAASLFALERADALPAPVLRALRGGLYERVVQRLTSPRDALAFAQLYVDLLSGSTIYRYVGGSLPSPAAWLHLLGGAVLIAGLLGAAVPKLWAARRWPDVALLLGILLSLVFAYPIAGLKLLAPHTERYGMFLTVPSCYAFALCAEALAGSPRAAAWIRAATAGLGAILLLSFAQHHLRALQSADPQRDDGFRSGAIEPKQAALAAIVRMRGPSRTAVVLAQDWWTYWPIRYLAHADPRLRITIAGMPRDPRFPPDFDLPRFDPSTMALFAVAWAGGPFDRVLQRSAIEQASVYGYESGPILRVYRLAAPQQRAATGAARTD